MVHRCCISSCKMNVRVAEAKGLSYHCFPLKDPHREKWIQAILPHVEKPENFKIVQGYTRVCSRHFRLKEYSLDSKKRARLNSNAVPSVFPRKNSPVFVQPLVEATKSQLGKIKNVATTTATTPAVLAPIMSSSSSSSSAAEEEPQAGTSRKQSRTSEDLPPLKAQIICDQGNVSVAEKQLAVNVVSSVKGTSSVEGIRESCPPPAAVSQLAEEAHSDVSSDEKGDQSKRKRRKWNRTAFGRTCKSKQKKSSTSPLDPALCQNDEDGLDDFASIIAVTRSNSLDLEQSELDLKRELGNLGLSAGGGTGEKSCLQQSTSSSSSLSVSDQLQVEDLNLMSVEEQELLESIQAVSLDCGEADMNLNMKNIHLGASDLTPLLTSEVEKKPLLDPILLEDALISSASEMSLQPKKKKEKSSECCDGRVGTTPRPPPSASEIEKLACELSSSLLTSVTLPSGIDLALDDDDELRLPVSGVPNQSSISIDLPENVLVSDGEGSDEKQQQSGGNEKSEPIILLAKAVAKSGSNKKGTVPKKKLVGIQKKPKNSDKCFGKFSVERFSDSDKDIEYYTGFPTFAHFEAFFNSLESHVEKLKVTDIMHGVADLIRNQQQQLLLDNNGSSNGTQGKDEGTNRDTTTPEEQKRRPITGRSMSRIDELFMTLIRLKRRLPEKVLGHMFFVSQPTVSRTIRAWTMLLSKLLEPIPSACESLTSTSSSSLTHTSAIESSKSRQGTSKSANLEQNYFTSRGIYIPDSFRQLFQSDLAMSIISSAQNPRNSSSSASLNSTITAQPPIVKIIATTNNNNSNNNNNNNSSISSNQRNLNKNLEQDSGLSCVCGEDEDFPCNHCIGRGRGRRYLDDGSVPFSSLMLDPSVHELHGDLHQWGLIVKD